MVETAAGTYAHVVIRDVSSGALFRPSPPEGLAQRLSSVQSLPIHPLRRSTTAKELTERDSQIIPNQRQWMPAKGGTMLSLKTMTKSKLKVLKREVEAAIHVKATARRQEIASELSKLSLLDGGGRAKVVRAAAKGMGAAKYRNSAPARKAAGRKLDAPLISDIPKVSKSAKKTRKTKKMRDAGNITQAVLLTSARTDHTEALRIEPLNDPLPIEPLSGTSLYPNTIPGDLGASA